MLDDPDDLIFPYLGEDAKVGLVKGISSKIVFQAAAGRGAQVAIAAKVAVDREWDALVRSTFGTRMATPGFPDVWWATVTGSDAEYPVLWTQLRRLVAARRRSMMHRMAMLAAGRLAALADPAGAAEMRAALRLE